MNDLSNKLKEVAYFFLKIMTGNKGVERNINDFKVRFPARWSRYYESDYEAGNYKFLKNHVKPGMHIIDVGAHLGLFSVVSSQLTTETGKVVCFEPASGTYELLKQTLQLNHCRNVTAIQGAVSNKEGSATFYIGPTAGCNSNSLVNNQPEKGGTTNEVKLFTIDGIASTDSLQPGLIKIDAEGAEFDILKGAASTLRQYKPILILGLHPGFIRQKGDSLGDIWDLLQRSGYEVNENENRLTRSDFCNRTLLFDVHCIGSKSAG